MGLCGMMPSESGAADGLETPQGRDSGRSSFKCASRLRSDEEDFSQFVVARRSSN
jgi:hypothetical protein